VPKKKRLDVVLAERGLTHSRSRAQALVIAGRVKVDGVVVTKAGTGISEDSRVEVIEPDHPYVGRGALKLVAALDAFDIDPANLFCLDVGASTGGFTDVLLTRGARRVIALDVGRGQLDWKLRSDQRVVVMEGINARHLGPDDLEFPVQLIVMDLSFISLTKVVPAVIQHLEPGGHLICLIKPQFEAGRHEVGRGGIVRDEAVRTRVVSATINALEGLGLTLIGQVPSPIRGQKGNQEDLAVFRKSVK